MDNNIKIISKNIHDKNIEQLVSDHGNIFDFVDFEYIFKWGQTLSTMLGKDFIYKGELDYQEGVLNAKYERKSSSDFILVKIKNA